MARKSRKKKKKIGQSVKFEVYGILIIVFAIISLAGKGEIPGIGSVGRSLSSIFLFLTGRLYFVIPLIAIVIGLFLMIKRSWPKGWSYRKTGILLMILGLLTVYHISLFSLLDPEGLYTSGDIMRQPYENTSQMLAQDKSSEAYMRALGGGMVGAFTYGLLYFLFDHLGAKLVVIAMFAIGLICLTGWSYGEMGLKLKRYIQPMLKKFRLRVKDATRLAKEKKQNRPPKQPLSIVTEEEPEHVEPTHTGSSLSSVDTMEVPQSEQPLSPLIRDFQDHTSMTQHDEGQPQLKLEKSEENLTEDTDTRQVKVSKERGTIEVTFNAAPSADDSLEPPYRLPAFDLLTRPEQSGQGTASINYKENAKKLEDTLESFGVGARVLEVVKGPSVTRYEIQPDSGVKVSRVVSLTDDIALALAAKDIRMEAPIPGKAAIGIEVPNSTVSLVSLREVMESTSFEESMSKVSVGLGRDISGKPIVADLSKMPHMLVAGATGSGKSVCINGVIVSILYKAKPDEVKFLMIDPKKVELNVYNGIPHLLAPVVTDPRRASLALRKIVVEMEGRYELFSESGTRNIAGYNEWAQQNEAEPLPLIVVIVDELADLMMVAANDVEDSITRLAQMARAAGIHLIIATQRPSVNVITGVIKANIPSRIAFGVSSQIDSRTILDSAGAEKLLGRGDMLYLPVGASKPTRIQGAFLSDAEVESVVQFAKSQGEAEYREELVPEVDEEALISPDEQQDELYGNAVQIVVEAKQASVSLLQRRMRIGYTRAARLIDSMEAKGIVGPYEGSKPREVLITTEEFAQRNVGS